MAGPGPTPEEPVAAGGFSPWIPRAATRLMSLDSLSYTLRRVARLQSGIRDPVRFGRNGGKAMGPGELGF